ncbi:MAG TPA: hypothetical protein PLV25_07055 [Opitutales bacterium]|nr:hypothetical protein [Opitutales bacterium]
MPFAGFAGKPSQQAQGVGGSRLVLGLARLTLKPQRLKPCARRIEQIRAAVDVQDLEDLHLAEPGRLHWMGKLREVFEAWNYVLRPAHVGSTSAEQVPQIAGEGEVWLQRRAAVLVRMCRTPTDRSLEGWAEYFGCEYVLDALRVQPREGHRTLIMDLQ